MVCQYGRASGVCDNSSNVVWQYGRASGVCDNTSNVKDAASTAVRQVCAITVGM